MPSSKAQTILVVLAIIYTLYIAQSLILPLVVALVLAMALHPSIRCLKRMNIPRPLGALLVLVPTLVVMGYGANQIYRPAMDWISTAPSSLREAQYRMQDWIRPVHEVSKAAEEVQKITESDGEEEKPEVVLKKPSVQEALFDGTQKFLSYAFIIVFLVYFLLASGETLLMGWIDHIFRPCDRDLSKSIIKETERYISRYLTTITCINIGLGAVIGFAMYLFGMPSPLLWGVLAAVLNFVPYVGAIAGMSVVAVVAVLSFDTVAQALMVPLTYLGITGLEGLCLTPMILGRRFALHPVVIFTWLLFMSFLWGIPGALLAVPTLTIMKIVADHSKTLEPLGRIISRDEPSPRLAEQVAELSD